MNTVKSLQKQLETRLCNEIILNLQLLIVKIGELKRFSAILLNNEQEVLNRTDEYILKYSKHFEKSFTEILNMVRLLPDKKVSRDYSLNNMYRKDMDVVLKSEYEFHKFDLDEDEFISAFKTHLDFHKDIFYNMYLTLRRFEEDDIEQIIEFVIGLRQIVVHIREEFEEIRAGRSM